MSQFIAVIDIGKTNAKVAIVDNNEWREIAVQTIPNKVLSGPPYPHFDVDRIWHFIQVSIAKLNGLYPISAISISTHGACGALLKADGNLALPVLDYEYDGPQKTSHAYDVVRPAFSETGSPRLKNGLNLGAQLFWQFAEYPAETAEVAQIVTYPQYWVHRLTGVTSNEVTSLGCHTDLWNPWKGEFSSLVASQGWLDLMAPVHKASQRIGTVDASFAEKTGLSKQTPVICGIHDSNASLLPHIIMRRAPFSVVSSGTWTIAMAIGGSNTVLDEARDILVNVNAHGNAVPSARFMGGREFDILMDGREPDCSEADVSAVLERQTGILPSAASQFGPFQGSELSWYGPPVRNDGERFAAVSFYLALTTAKCLQLIGALGPTIVEGPFAKNDLYLEMLATATTRSVVVSNTSATGTSVGAAMLFETTNSSGSLSEKNVEKVFEPGIRSDAESYAESWEMQVSKIEQGKV